MAELSLERGLTAAVGFAGDSFNTAIYLRRLGCETAYATVSGDDDPFTDGILALMQDEDLDGSLVASAPGCLPGLYAIELDDHGERRFFYWRNEAAVRQFAVRADLVFLSAVTLAVIGEAGRKALIPRLPPGRIGVDLNYRPRLWDSPDAARGAIEAVAPFCRLISASAEDLKPLGLLDAPPAGHRRARKSWCAIRSTHPVKAAAAVCL